MTGDGRLFDPRDYAGRDREARRRRAEAVRIGGEWILLRRIDAGPIAHLRRGDGTPNQDGAVRAVCGAVALPLTDVAFGIACDRCMRVALDRGLI